MSVETRATEGLLTWSPRLVTTRGLFAVSVAVGALLGLAAVGGFRIAIAVEVFMSQFGLFVVVPAVVGFHAVARRVAAWAATTVLIVMCLVYYLPYATSLLSFLLAAVVWTVLSLVAGPVFGLAGHALRIDDRRAAVAAAGLIGLLAGEFLRMGQKGLNQGDLDLLSLTLAFDAAALAALAVLIRPGRRGRVLAYALPMTVVGYLVTYVLR